MRAMKAKNCSALAFVGFLGALALLSSPKADAQNVSPEMRRELDAAFQGILADPTNLDKTYDYAKMATAAGDYEAAITSYERLLLFNPDLPRVKTELGILYYRLGSFDTARSYLTDALKSPGVPVEVQDRIQEFLSKIDETKSKNRFSGSLAFGGRYQSNANYGPEGQVLVLNAPANPNDDTEADDDFNAFFALTGRYVYDIGNDAGDFFGIEGSVYGARQLELTTLDVEHFRVIAGPGLRYYPSPDTPVLVRPHMRATYVRLDDESYNFSLGGGLDIDWKAFDKTTLFLNSLAEDREYYVTKERQNSNTQDGAAYEVALGAIHEIDQNMAVRGRVFAGIVDARSDFEAYRELGASMTFNMRFDSPFEGDEDFALVAAPWNFSLNGRYSNREHDGPNLLVANDTRQDDDIRVNSTVAVPLADGWSVFTTLGYQWNLSNIPNNDFENFSATLGANLRF